LIYQQLYSFRDKITVIARRFLPKQSLGFQRIASLACGTGAFGATAGARAGAEKRSQETVSLRVQRSSPLEVSRLLHFVRNDRRFCPKEWPFGQVPLAMTVKK
jgi:hypothetical protein